NYYNSPGWGAPIIADAGYRGKLTNINLGGDIGLYHMAIDKNPRVQTEIERPILAVRQPQAQAEAQARKGALTSERKSGPPLHGFQTRRLVGRCVQALDSAKFRVAQELLRLLRAAMFDGEAHSQSCPFKCAFNRAVRHHHWIIFISRRSNKTGTSK